MKFVHILENCETGRQYRLDREMTKYTCMGCAFDDETELCLNAGSICGDQDMIWTEILKVEKVD